MEKDRIVAIFNINNRADQKVQFEILDAIFGNLKILMLKIWNFLRNVKTSQFSN